MKLKIVFLCIAAHVLIADCRKIKPPIDKNANLAFINNEGGGAKPPAKIPAAVPDNNKPLSTSNSAPAKVDPLKGTVTSPAPKPTPAAVKPVVTNKPALPAPVKPIPQKPVSSPPVSTPGPGSVQQLINYYDSQGKASPIRPYSYSQAVKQG